MKEIIVTSLEIRRKVSQKPCTYIFAKYGSLALDICCLFKMGDEKGIEGDVKRAEGLTYYL